MSTPAAPNLTPDITIDQYRELLRGTQVKCEICGHQAHSLVLHLRTKHNSMSATQYRNAYPKARLYSTVLGEILRRIDRKEVGSDQFNDHMKYISLAGAPDAVFSSVRSQVQYGSHLDEFIPELIPDFMFEDVDKRIAFALVRCENLYIEGPTGAGKSDVVAQVCTRMKVPMRRVNMNGDTTYKSFVGSKEAGPNGTYFKEGILPFCMENGLPLLVDEVDMTPPPISATLHPVMEKNHRQVYIPEAGKTYVAKKGFTVIGTANTGGKGDATGVYTGTEVQNTAFLNRFSLKMKKNYLPADKEEALLSRRFPSEPPAMVRKMVQLANEIRTAFLQGQIPLSYSTRNLIDFFGFKPELGLEETLNATLLDWYDADDKALITTFIDRIQVRTQAKAK